MNAVMIARRLACAAPVVAALSLTGCVVYVPARPAAYPVAAYPGDAAAAQVYRDWRARTYGTPANPPVPSYVPPPAPGWSPIQRADAAPVPPPRTASPDPPALPPSFDTDPCKPGDWWRICHALPN